MKTLSLLIILLSLTVLSCNINNENNSKTNNTQDTIVDIQSNKIVKPDTIHTSINKENEYGKFLDFLKANHIISNKFRITDVLSKKEIIKNKGLSLVLFQLNTDKDYDVNCSDPICVWVVLIKNQKPVLYSKIPVVYEEDFKFLFTDRHYSYFEYYSSPVGFSEYYIFDTANNKIYKTERIEEGEKVIRDSFNFSDKTFKIKSQDGNKTILKKIFS